MSYARFEVGVSDVYVYWDVHAGLICCWCDLLEAPSPLDFRASGYGEMVAHLRKHRNAGHAVPQRAVDALEAREFR